MYVLNSLSSMVSQYETDAKLMDFITNKTRKIKFLKRELHIAKANLIRSDDEWLLAKGRNFEINQRLVRIVENKDAPYVDYMSRLLDVKLLVETYSTNCKSPNCFDVSICST